MEGIHLRGLAAFFIVVSLATSLLAVGGANAETRQASVWNGRRAADGEFPGAALLGFKGDGFVGGCSGNLIRPRLVLTAAHCLERVPAQPIVVRLGGTQIGDGFEEVFTTRRHTLHPKYRPRSLAYDFALLRLPRASRYTPAPFARYGDRDAWAVGNDAWVVGWGGVNDWGDGRGALRVGATTVRSQQSCERRFGRHDPDSMVCLDGSQASGCPGDSGGPVYAAFRGGVTQLGVTSHGKDGCATSNPRWVAAWLPAAARWIDRTQRNGIAKLDTVSVLNASKSTVRYGHSLRIVAGVYSPERGQYLSYQKVRLQRRRPGATTWRNVDTKGTGPYQSVSFRVWPARDAVYRVRHLGSGGTHKSTSARQHIDVRR